MPTAIIPYFIPKGQNAYTMFQEYERLANEGCSVSTYNLANCYLFGQGVKQNSELAVHLLTELAEFGDVEALNNLALCYKMGLGVKQNVGFARDLLLSAAEKGHARSQYNLGSLYLHLHKNKITLVPNDAFDYFENGMAYMEVAAFNGHVGAHDYLIFHKLNNLSAI